jgi:hypothetical protein
MTYTVVWELSAEAHLAHLWNSATDRADVTAAANAIDKCLADDPHAYGESGKAQHVFGSCPRSPFSTP